ncbi:MAG TPA: methyltransferase [Balneolales bacterium]|nr:methyltransferase [Balneolales bacterium]
MKDQNYRFESKLETVEEVTPKNILQVGQAFFSSKLLLCAVKLELFTLLSGNPLSAEQIQIKLNLHKRGIYDFLDALVAIGFLKRDGLKEGAIYKNSPETDLFLDKNKREYIGGILEMSNDRLYPFFGNLDDALRTGKPQNESRDKEVNVFDELYSDEYRLKQFINAMSSVQKMNFKLLTEIFDFSQYKTLCDIGGADGSLCLAVAEQFEHINCIAFDLPKVISIAHEKIEKANLADRILTVPGDFWKDDLPKADVITMGNILHDWGMDEKMAILEKVYASLPDGGACIVIENIIDDNRSKNVSGLLMSLNMLVETPGGFNFTRQDFDNWIKKTGFSHSELIPLTGHSSAAIAYK